ncbi:hypothetical protein HK097_004166 [Rhizophlyctis rosea]|uniref:PH domain-containing protein n=1 Tax=Rhizophlyctis rosea TaxID=64517 RepID=A0AAD5SEB2_9FUNG|nr:hypothetical protein HK097_004166 [Rhizophlyctis rosea]
MTTETPAVNPPTATTTETAAPSPTTAAPLEPSAAPAEVLIPEATAPAPAVASEPAAETKAEEPVAVTEAPKEDPKPETTDVAPPKAEDEPTSTVEAVEGSAPAPAAVETAAPVVEEEAIEPIKEGILKKSNIFGLGGSIRYYVVATAPTPLESLALVHQRNPGKARDIATAAATDKGVLLAYRNKAAVGQHPVAIINLHSIETISVARGDTFTVKISGKQYNFSAESSKAAKSWVKTLTDLKTELDELPKVTETEEYKAAYAKLADGSAFKSAKPAEVAASDDHVLSDEEPSSPPPTRSTEKLTAEKLKKRLTAFLPKTSETAAPATTSAAEVPKPVEAAAEGKGKEVEPVAGATTAEVEAKEAAPEQPLIEEEKKEEGKADEVAAKTPQPQKRFSFSVPAFFKAKSNPNVTAAESKEALPEPPKDVVAVETPAPTLEGAAAADKAAEPTTVPTDAVEPAAAPAAAVEPAAETAKEVEPPKDVEAPKTDAGPSTTSPKEEKNFFTFLRKKATVVVKKTQELAQEAQKVAQESTKAATEKKEEKKEEAKEVPAASTTGETVVALPATETPTRELKEDAALAAVAVEALEPEGGEKKVEEKKEEEVKAEAPVESAAAPVVVEDLKKSSPPKKRFSFFNFGKKEKAPSPASTLVEAEPAAQVTEEPKVGEAKVAEPEAVAAKEGDETIVEAVVAAGQKVAEAEETKVVEKEAAVEEKKVTAASELAAETPSSTAVKA